MVLFKASPTTWALDPIFSYLLMDPNFATVPVSEMSNMLWYYALKCKTNKKAPSSIFLWLYFTVPFKLNSKKELSSLSYNVSTSGSPFSSIYSDHIVVIDTSLKLLLLRYLITSNSNYWILTISYQLYDSIVPPTLKHFF